MKNTKLKLSLLFLLGLIFVGCDSDEIEELKNRLSDAEQRLSSQDQTMHLNLTTLINDGSCHLTDIEEDQALLQCGDGSSFLIKNGDDGEDGAAGTSCSVEEIENVGALITCGEGEAATTAIVHNGQNGQNGVSEAIEVINPCEDEDLDEVLLRFDDGTLIAHYSDGDRQHLTAIRPGSYRTTDGYACNFSVDENGEVSDN